MGLYKADIVVEETVIVELKCCNWTLDKIWRFFAHASQLDLRAWRRSEFKTNKRRDGEAQGTQRNFQLVISEIPISIFLINYEH